MATVMTDAVQEARKVVNSYADVAGMGGWVPGSNVILGPAQFKMVEEIARCFGVKGIDVQAVLSTHTAADVLLSLIPRLGWLIKLGMASALTKAAGEQIIDHFRNSASRRD